MTRTLALILAGAAFLVAGMSLAATAAPAAPGDPANGKVLYESRCGACHSLDANRVGPAHRGVYGRHVGTAPGFDYSPSLKNAQIVWNGATLDAWRTDPEKLIPGQRMNYSVPDAKDRADVIAYLKQESGQ